MIVDTLIQQYLRQHNTFADVPTCVHAFTSEEQNGVFFSDSVGNMVVKPTEITFGVNANGANWVRPNEPLAGFGTEANIPSIPLYSGSPVDMGVNSFGMVVVGEADPDIDATGGGFRIENRIVQADILPGYGVGGSNSNSEASGNINVGTTSEDHYTARPTRGGTADLVNGNDFLFDLRVERTTSPHGSLYFRRRNLTAGTEVSETVNQPDPGNGTTFLDAIRSCTPDAHTKIRGIKIYGCAIFKFSGALPADYAFAVDWMSRAWRLGYKIPYYGCGAWK